MNAASIGTAGNLSSWHRLLLTVGLWDGAGFVLIAAGLLIRFPPVVLRAI